MQPCSTSLTGEASGVWNSQYLVYLPLIAELTALNKGCAGEEGRLGCPSQLCQCRVRCPLRREEEGTFLIGLAENGVR